MRESRRAKWHYMLAIPVTVLTAMYLFASIVFGLALVRSAGKVLPVSFQYMMTVFVAALLLAVSSVLSYWLVYSFLRTELVRFHLRWARLVTLVTVPTVSYLLWQHAAGFFWNPLDASASIVVLITGATALSQLVLWILIEKSGAARTS